MTDAPTINHKIKALELANQHTAEPADVVKRATAYHAFLSGAAAPAAGATAGATPPKTTAGATAGATPPKTPAAGAAGAAKPGAAGAANKPAANKPAAGAAKPGAAGAANKPAAGAAKTPAAGAAKAGAAKPGAGASAGAIPGDTKAPDGVHTYAEVVAKLREVSGEGGVNRDAAFKILDDNGGAKSVRELKPANYDAVVAAAEALLAGGGEAAGAADDDLLGDPPEQTAGGLAADMDPTAQAPRDDMGL